MGYVLDAILKRTVVEGPLIIDDHFESDPINMQHREAEFSIQLDYSEGDGSVDMNLYLQGSVDGITYVDMTSPQNITDDEGTHVWDVTGTGVSYVRIRIEHLPGSGSMNLQKIFVSAKRRH